LVEHRVGGNVVEQVIDHVQLGEMIGIVDGREAQGRQVHPGALDVLLLVVEFRGHRNGQWFAAHHEGRSLGRLQFPVVQHHLVAPIAG